MDNAMAVSKCEVNIEQLYTQKLIHIYFLFEYKKLVFFDITEYTYTFILMLSNRNSIWFKDSNYSYLSVL